MEQSLRYKFVFKCEDILIAPMVGPKQQLIYKFCKTCNIGDKQVRVAGKGL